MDEVNALQNIDFFEVFVGFVSIIVAFNFLYKNIVENIIQKFGIETKGMRKRREEHELLIKTAENLGELQNKHNDIQTDLKNLTKMFIDKEINDFRWEIINFATKVAEGKPCNKDSYKHCLRTYEKYEKLLEEHGLENGEVEISMDIVRESYADKLKNGF